MAFNSATLAASLTVTATEPKNEKSPAFVTKAMVRLTLLPVIVVLVTPTVTVVLPSIVFKSPASTEASVTEIV